MVYAVKNITVEALYVCDRPARVVGMPRGFQNNEKVPTKIWAKFPKFTILARTPISAPKVWPFLGGSTTGCEERIFAWELPRRDTCWTSERETVTFAGHMLITHPALLVFIFKYALHALYPDPRS